MNLTTGHEAIPYHFCRTINLTKFRFDPGAGKNISHLGIPNKIYLPVSKPLIIGMNDSFISLPIISSYPDTECSSLSHHSINTHLFFFAGKCTLTFIQTNTE